jgi:hypothetical protein
MSLQNFRQRLRSFKVILSDSSQISKSKNIMFPMCLLRGRLKGEGIGQNKEGKRTLQVQRGDRKWSVDLIRTFPYHECHGKKFKIMRWE